jgi:hypothetical protein
VEALSVEYDLFAEMTGEVDTEQTEECPNVNRYVNRRTRVPFAPASGKVNIDKKSEFCPTVFV